jgi:hypothetical protein
MFIHLFAKLSEITSQLVCEMDVCMGFVRKWFGCTRDWSGIAEFWVDMRYTYVVLAGVYVGFLIEVTDFFPPCLK